MKKFLFCLALVTLVGFSNVSGGKAANHNTPPDNRTTEMDHSNSDKETKGFKKAENPTYKVGSQAIIRADHMKGMKGAIATIVGAYDTIAYIVTYTPTTGGEKVKNHKWVVQEEIENAGNIPFKPRTEVILKADHHKGMKGATAIIESGEKTTVYMIDYTPTTGGKRVKNHKWVTESELKAIQKP
ncbi:YdhK family protein [Baia soyae]|uniref:YdhK family protein n=1 Tax=Baia soyae TaxID=1544746 RepID=UPI001FB1FD68|nr:YdhK family protein [Baia soyae]